MSELLDEAWKEYTESLNRYTESLNRYLLSIGWTKRRVTVGDGTAVFNSPEFKALCMRAGVLLTEEVEIRSGCGNSDDVELYHSEEFKAFCKRFGIRHEAPTVSISLRVKAGEAPRVTHEYCLEDDSQEAVAEADVPVVVEGKK
jgi:hypothetical protein